MRSRGMRSSCAHVALIALVAVIGSCDTARTSHTSAATAPLRWQRAHHLPVPTIVHVADFDPLTIRERPGGFAALDRYAQQLVLFDSSLQVSRRVSRRGGGPGELDGVIRLERWAHGLAVGEGRNARISLFTDDGSFRGVAGSRYPGTPFALRSDRRLAVPAQRSDILVETALFDARERGGLGVRAPSTTPADERFVGMDLLAYRNDGSLLVLENRNGALLALADDGRVTAEWTLPDDWLASLRARRGTRVAAVEAIAGARVFGAPLFKDLSLSGDRALVLQPLAPHCLLLIDLVQSTIVPLSTNDPELDASLCRAESAVLTPQRLVVAVSDSLIHFRSPIGA